MATILVLHHQHMKLVKPFRPMLLRAPSEKVFDQSICRTKEQKARLQCLASAMLKSVTPSVGTFKVIKVIFFLCFRQL